MADSGSEIGKTDFNISGNCKSKHLTDELTDNMHAPTDFDKSSVKQPIASL